MSETTLSFFRRYGARTPSQVTSPTLHPIEKLEFPQRAVWHYLNFDGIERGPAADDFLFRNISRPIPLIMVMDLATREGAPREMTLSQTVFLSDYRKTNRRVRPTKSLTSIVGDPNALLLVNYCGLGFRYRYPKSAFIEHHRWKNAFATWVETLKAMLPESDVHHHYLMLSAPRVLASVGQFESVKDTLTQPQLKQFPERNAWVALELFKWLGEDEGTPSTNLFSAIPKERLHQVNLIFREVSSWGVLNLGTLYTLKQGVKTPGTFAKTPWDGSGNQLEVKRLQRTLIHYLMEVTSARTVTANTDEASDVAEDRAAAGDVEVSAREELLRINQILDGDDVDPEERAALQAQQAAIMDRELAKLNDIRQHGEDEEAADLNAVLAEQAPDTHEGVMGVCENLASQGLLTGREYARFQKLALSYKDRTNPYTDEPVEASLNIDPKAYEFKPTAQVAPSQHVLDPTMSGSKLRAFDEQYVREMYPRHMVAAVMGVQNAGVAVTEHHVEVEQDIMGRTEVHTVRLVPVEGAPSTLTFKVPVIDEDGTFTTNGVKYRLRKQFGDIPIRKVGPNRVALTSYYGKAFIERGRRKTHDYGAWLGARVMAKALDPKDPDLTEIKLGACSVQEHTLPRSFTAIGAQIRQVKCRGFHLYFDLKEVREVVGDRDVNAFKVQGYTVIGTNLEDTLIALDAEGAVYFCGLQGAKLFGTLEAFLNIPVAGAPVEFAECKVFGKPIAVGVLLAYHLGLSDLMSLLKVEPRRIMVGERGQPLAPDEWDLRFSDERLVFSRNDRLACMVLGGFQEFHRTISNYSVWSFDKPGVYLNLLEANKISARFIREVELMFKMFVDPITKDLLKQMKEPQTFKGLLLRSAQMLLEDQHPDELDPKFMRIKGYERVSGFVYNELVQSLRVHGGMLGKSNQKITMNPFAVMKRVTQDPSKSQVSEINPIESLKQIEAVTFAGDGGRSKQSMTRGTRAYHKNNVGVISEATVDSSDVGINVYLSANPNLNNLTGTITPTSLDQEKGMGRVLSTSALLTPSAIKDDAKRVNFIGIQRAHVVPCEGYTQAIIQTGMEEEVAHNNSDMFAVTAKKKGRVISLTDKGIIVEYEDGEQVGYEVGRRFGNASGLTIAHEVITALKPGDSFDVGDAICYNRHFFEPSFFNRKRLAMKDGIPARVVLWESSGTLEDASSISPKLASGLMTKMTKIKDIVVRFDQAVDRLIVEGTPVEVDTVLCYVQDESTANSGLFTEENLDTLRMMGTHAPRAGVKGRVERVEIYYHGEVEDLSPTLLKLARASDRNFKERAMQTKRMVHTGKVDTAFRLKGEALPPDNLAIRIYITSDVPAGIGDKGVFSAQLKTVFSGLMEKPYTTEDLKPIDAIFGGQSIDARIVETAYENGTAVPLLMKMTELVLAEYDK